MNELQQLKFFILVPWDRVDRLYDRSVDFYRVGVKVTCVQNLFRLACYYGSLKIARYLYTHDITDPYGLDEDGNSGPYVNINEIFDYLTFEDQDALFYLEADMYDDIYELDGMTMCQIAEKYGKNPELTKWMQSHCNGGA